MEKIKLQEGITCNIYSCRAYTLEGKVCVPLDLLPNGQWQSGDFFVIFGGPFRYKRLGSKRMTQAKAQQCMV
jgi:hypothetical protein